MSKMVEPELRFSQRDYELLPEELRVELIGGELLKMPSPTVGHQQIISRLLFALGRVLEEERVLVGPTDFRIDEWNILVPDLVVMSDALGYRPRQQYLPAVDLVFEVLSPGTRSRDLAVKADLYLGAGVSEVWLVDPRSRSIEVRTTGCVTRFESAAVSEAVPGFSISTKNLFRA